MGTAAMRIENRARTAGLYFEALSGRKPAFHLLDSDEEIPADTDSTIRLPREVASSEDPRENWLWYKTALTFRALRYHPTWGTFALPGGTADRVNIDGRTLLHRSLAALPNPSAAKAIFEIVDGARLDAATRRLQPGMAEGVALVHRWAVADVLGGLEARSPRSQLLTALLGTSLLDSRQTVTVGGSVAALVEQATNLLDQATGSVTVEAALGLTDSLYSLVMQLPPLEADDRGTDVILNPLTERALEVWPDAEPLVRGAEGIIEGASQFGLGLPVVRYRGGLGTRDLDHRDSGRFRSSALMAWREGVDEGVATGPTIETDDDRGEDNGPPEPIPHEHGDVPRWEVPWVPPVSVRAGNVARYPEWDTFRGQYIPDHCRVIEEPLPSGQRSGFAGRAVRMHRATVTALLREWARIPREGLRLQRRLPDGDEVDLDHAISARVDLKAGVPVDDRVYQRKIPVERNVASVVLIDVSMSTADRVDRTDDAIVDEMALHLYGKPYRTVLDHEREAGLLLAEMMDRIADQSLVLAFSSSGKEFVRVQIVKDLHELASADGSGRFEALKPLDATRMGAAIRHATARLRRIDARSRFMIVVSDGLPYDEGYGTDYGEGEATYALHDTIRALDEAAEADVEVRMLLTGSEDIDDAMLAQLGERVSLVPTAEDLIEVMADQYLGMRTRSVTDRATVRAS